MADDQVQELNELQALAEEHGLVLGLRFMPVHDDEEPLQLIPVFASIMEQRDLVSLKFHDPYSGEQAPGVLFTEDQWRKLVTEPFHDDDTEVDDE